MDDKTPQDPETGDSAAPETPLPNIEAFTNPSKKISRRNLYIGVGLAIVLALAASSFLIVHSSPKKPASSAATQPGG